MGNQCLRSVWDPWRRCSLEQRDRCQGRVAILCSPELPGGDALPLATTGAFKERVTTRPKRPALVHSLRPSPIGVLHSLLMTCTAIRPAKTLLPTSAASWLLI